MKIVTLFSIVLFTVSAHAQNICDEYITNEWPDSRYSIESIVGDNVVIDNNTKLMWKQCSEGLSGTGCIDGAVFTSNWKAVLDSAMALNNDTGFAEFNDWRVPNIEELRSIATLNCSNPAINESVFPNTPPSTYWSSSPFAIHPDKAWSLSFLNGAGNAISRETSYSVRLVRSSK